VRAAFGVPEDHEPIGAIAHRPASPGRVNWVGLAGAAPPGAGRPLGPLVNQERPSLRAIEMTGHMQRAVSAAIYSDADEASNSPG
jgi:hypothetical protein